MSWRRSDEAAVEDQPTLPELEDAEQVVRVLVPVDDDEEDPRADHGGDQDPEGEVEHLLAVEPAPLGRARGEEHGDEESGRHQDPVGVHRDGQGPLELEDVLSGERLDRGEQHDRAADGPGGERLPGILLAGEARRAHLPGAGSDGDGQPDHDAQRGRDRHGEENG
jgi:hypothetical protein